MPTKSIFSEPFDDGTLFKLKIFNDYFKEWLPVFVSPQKPRYTKIQIFDLFAGMGKDENNTSGSPLLILNELNKWKTLIQEHKLDVTVVLNEYEKKYFLPLKENVKDIYDEKVYKFRCINDDFKIVFDEYYPSMQESVNFLFLDQNGIKQITESIFKSIIQLKQTDFLFFISSSFIKRFAEVENFQKYLKITKQDLDSKSYYHIHRIILEYYRSLIPADVRYYLAPFSIKKPAGIYGLIFGSNHIYGLEKFLRVCWKHDKLTGEANFDIDNEKIDLQKPTLFVEFNVPKKIQLFEKELGNKILSGELATDLMVYTFTLEQGFLPRHANEILSRLLGTKKIEFNFPLISSKVHQIVNPSSIRIK